MKLSEIDYKLPGGLIAQSPAYPRDHCKLMVIKRRTKEILHRHFYDLHEFLTSNDVLVFNKTKVFPARAFGLKETGGKVEVLFLRNIDNFKWEMITKPGVKAGQKIIFDRFKCEIIKKNGKVVIAKFDISYLNLLKALEKIGHTPLPPYIKSSKPESKLREEYQTVYAENLGSAAAPTAGLHFTKSLLAKLKDKGIQMEYVTLHVGLGTFEPVHEENLQDHKIHEEYFEIEKKTLDRLIKAKNEGKRIISVGTTTTRVLETVANIGYTTRIGMTDLYILPAYKFKFINGLITNFHLPKSTLLALVFAFGGKALIKKSYKIAIQNKYRFFSFGDATLII